MRAEGGEDAASWAEGPAQASPGQASLPREGCKPFYAGTSAALGMAWEQDKALKGRHKLSRPFRAWFISSHESQGGVRVRRGLTLGWLVSGLWPAIHRRLCQSAGQAPSPIAKRPSTSPPPPAMRQECQRPSLPSLLPRGKNPPQSPSPLRD